MLTLRFVNPRFAPLFLLIGMAHSVSWGQSSALYNLEWDSIDAGSGQAQSGNYQMNHTVGQPDAFPLQNGRYEIYGGFWGIVIQGITETPTATATGTPTSTATSTATVTPTITRISTPTSTATHTEVPIPTSTSIETNTATATPTATGTITPTVTTTVTVTTPSPTWTPPVTTTETPTSTRTNTPTPSVTPTPTCVANYDLNGDGHIDGGDLLLLLSYIRNNDLRGDFNCDGKTDYLDLLLFSRQWHQEQEDAS